MKKIKSLASLVLITSSSALSAAVVNVDFGANYNNTSYTEAGAYTDPDGGTIWNYPTAGENPSATNLKDSLGNTTTISIEVGGGTGQHGRSDLSHGLFRDGYVATGDSTISFGGLDDSKTYDLTFYVPFSDYDATFTVDAVSAAATGGPNVTPYTTIFTEGLNYVTLEGIATDGSGGIDVQVTNPGDNAHFVTGLQIATVPEPSSVGLLGIAGLVLILRRRK